jgi:hypothetical protein
MKGEANRPRTARLFEGSGVGATYQVLEGDLRTLGQHKFWDGIHTNTHSASSIGIPSLLPQITDISETLDISIAVFNTYLGHK